MLIVNKTWTKDSPGLYSLRIKPNTESGGAIIATVTRKQVGTTITWHLSVTVTKQLSCLAAVKIVSPTTVSVGGEQFLFDGLDIGWSSRYQAYTSLAAAQSAAYRLLQMSGVMYSTLWGYRV
jgi:hypothetical protein